MERERKRPTAFTASERGEESRYSQNHDAIARLAPGVTPAQAQAYEHRFAANPSWALAQASMTGMRRKAFVPD